MNLKTFHRGYAPKYVRKENSDNCTSLTIIRLCKHLYTVVLERNVMVVAKGDARELGDHELELLQISKNTSLQGLSVNFLR